MNVSAEIDDWSGEIAFAPMSALYFGIGGATPLHSTAAHKVIAGAREVTREDAGRNDSRSLAIPSATPHAFDGRSRKIAVAYLDARYFSWEDARALEAKWARLDPASATIDCLQEDISRLRPRALGNRLSRAMTALETLPSVRQSARSLGLSESRFTHLVSDELNAPPRQWRRWLRLRRAVDLIALGKNVTEAGHEAGFADSAHFSRACYGELGIRPSVLRSGRLQFQRSVESCNLAFD
uniref:helix-turn-helix domain-containing protein n=1 Tax=uncultured Altererythrobacter sp. TaxID=500840 RepID=UPI00260FEFCE|nr:helix-turn-helix domain-containing protein [uncultured Altererythrobacter sp.]